MDRENRLKRLRVRAWHRGTREADYMIGGFFDRYSGAWTEAELAWFEALIEEDAIEADRFSELATSFTPITADLACIA